jgi:hypothetical protein
MARKTTAKPPASTPAPAEIEAEFDALLAKCGHVVPADRRARLLAGYRDLKRQVALVKNEELGADVEPANTFSVVPYTSEA